jgi:Cys-tRNA(Pro)/Cys-tRNA(Cys) deacylase
MTPAINTARKNKIPHTVHEYVHNPQCNSYGEEAAEKIGVAAGRVFKTLVVSLDGGNLAVAVIPVSSMLSMKLMAKAAGAKKASMADPSDVTRATGYVLGGVSPLGQKNRLKTIIDSSAMSHATVFVSAGRRGLEIELGPDQLKQATSALLADICQ